MSDRGFVVWFTGLSGAGKTTIAERLAPLLRERGLNVEELDGDIVRQHLSKGLGFSKEDRDTNIRRIGFVAHLISRHGGVAITAAISPYRAIRDENRKLIGNFVETYCRCTVDDCEKRDVKGLYKKARQDSAAKILKRLHELGYMDAAAEASGDHRAHHEYVPDELVAQAEAALKKAG